MKTILIAQSVPYWITVIIDAISGRLPDLADCICFTDSFDFALDLVPKQGELIVISSGMFHDSLSEKRKTVAEKIPDNEKDGDKLAEEIKKINPEARIYVFSEYEPFESKYLDGFIKKIKGNNRESLTNLLKIFN
jgi:hypothetical protein